MDELTDSSSLRGDREALLARMDRDGYVFIRDVVPSADASRALQGCLEQLGFAKPGHDHPVWSGLDEDAVPAEVIHELVHDTVPLQEMWNTAPMPALFELLVGEPAFVFQYSDVRTYLPGQDHYLSPAHQDGHYIGPNTDYFTAWTPLTTIPRVLGGLAIAEGSNHKGVRQHRLREDRSSHLPGHARRYGIDDEDVPERWLTADYRLGDVLMFTPFTVHMAPSNRTPDRIRVSTDTRFQPASTARTGLALMTAKQVREHEMASAAAKRSE